MSDKKTNPEECAKEGCTSSAQDCAKDPASCMANSVYFGKTKGENKKGENKEGDDGESMDDCMGRSLDQLSKAFMSSARRWELMVYPSMVAFIILAGYGFFLIYSLTKDVHLVVQDMHKITASMERITINMDVMNKNMIVMTQTIDHQSGTMEKMAYHVSNMDRSMNRMRYDMQSVSRPMNFMNDFLPW